MKLLDLKLRIGPRLALGFGALTALLLVIGAVGMYGLYDGNQTTRNIIDKEWVKASLVNEMHALAGANQEATFKLSIIKNESERDQLKANVAERVKRIDAIFADLEPRLYKAEGKALMAEMKNARKTYVDSFKTTIGMSDAGRYDEAREYAAHTVAPNFDKFEGFMGQLAKLQNRLVDDAGAHSLKNYELNRNIAIGIGVFALLVGVALAWLTARHITGATGQLSDAVARVAAGDSSARSNVKSGDELETLSAAFDTMVAERVAALAQKEKESELLNNSIIDILRSVAKTAQGDLTIQAPVREDITGALSDAINSMSDSTARTLAKVTVAANEVRSASQDGRDTVLQTSRGMNDIRGTIQETAKRIKRLGERSQEITGIVKLIDDIAERTSVLALNANMQAAMAGEAGRGFRVVADEVQRLAERSKEATDQIGKLVGTIQAETNDTMSTMDRAIGEVVKGGELADKAAEKVTHLDELGGELLTSVGAFKLPEEALKQAGVGDSASRDNRRAA